MDDETAGSTTQRQQETAATEGADTELEEVFREHSPEPQEVHVPIKVNVDTPSCSITVTTTGVQTRSRAKSEDVDRSLPPVEQEKPKEKVSKWLGGVPKPTAAPRQSQAAPEARRTTRVGREVKKPVLFDPADENRRQKELRAELELKKSKDSKASKKDSKGDPSIPTQEEQRVERSKSKSTTSSQATGAVPKTRTISSKK